MEQNNNNQDVNSVCEWMKYGGMCPPYVISIINSKLEGQHIRVPLAATISPLILWAYFNPPSPWYEWCVQGRPHH